MTLFIWAQSWARYHATFDVLYMAYGDGSKAFDVQRRMYPDHYDALFRMVHS